MPNLLLNISSDEIVSCFYGMPTHSGLIYAEISLAIMVSDDIRYED